jgi:hypothetical protein
MIVRRNPIELQPRDIAVLSELLQSRTMTLRHVTELHFGGRQVVAKKRIARLKAAGFISERPRRGFEPSILFLTRKAFKQLGDAGQLTDYPALGVSAFEKRARVSDLTIRHELSVMEVKVAVSKAVRGLTAITLAQFSTWPKLYSFISSTQREGFRMVPGLVKPDGYIRLSQRIDDATVRSQAFFLEVDLTSESLPKLVSRAVAYLDYYRSGGYAVRQGGQADEYRRFPFRILAVFMSAERKRNFAQRLLANNPPIRHQLCLASFEDAVRDPLGSIWTTPADYESGNNDEGRTEPIARSLIAPNEKSGATI